MPSIPEVKSMMDAAYAAGTAYQSSLPFDTLRGMAIREASLHLASLERMTDVHTLDVGSGEGGIASFWPHKDIVGIEISSEAVKIAKDRYPEVDYRCCAIEDFKLSEGEEPFDLVVAQESIEHWTDVPAGLAAIRAAMKAEGRLVLTTPNRDSLHCRMSRKLGLGEAPKCSYDHVHEFGFEELIETVEKSGFRHKYQIGVHMAPYWALERALGHAIRRLTDTDEEVNGWMNEIASYAPAKYAFIQCHSFEKING